MNFQRISERGGEGVSKAILRISGNSFIFEGTGFLYRHGCLLVQAKLDVAALDRLHCIYFQLEKIVFQNVLDLKLFYIVVLHFI